MYYNKHMRNRRKWIIPSVIIAVVTIITVVFCVFAFMKNSKRIIAIKAYENYAWGFSYSGEAIFSDGTIYEWGVSEDYGSQGITKTHEEWILENGRLIDKVVSENDMKKIRRNIDSLNDDFQRSESFMNDFGSEYISVWKNNKEIYLEEYGDTPGKNDSKESQNLINIINKYLD